MSRTFLGFGQANYIGQPYTRPIKFAGIAGVAVPLLFQWLSYGASTAIPNINVGVNLEVSACKALDQIRSIYIDNLNSSVPVYIYFPDTGETLSAKANSEGWYPAFTNSRILWVVGEGFLDGNIPQTFIIVSNIPMAAVVNTEIDQATQLWLASPLISRGNSIYNRNYGIPALGDQTVQSIFNFGTPGVYSQNLWGSPYTSGFIYVTMIDFYLTGTTSDINASGSTIIVIESTGIAGTLFTLSYTFQSVNTLSGGVKSRDLGAPRLIGPVSGMNLKLDATQSWQIRVAQIVNGFNSTYSFNSNFTQNAS